MGRRERFCFVDNCGNEKLPFSPWCAEHKPHPSSGTYIEMLGETERVQTILASSVPSVKTKYGRSVLYVAYAESRAVTGQGYGPDHAIAELGKVCDRYYGSNTHPIGVLLGDRTSRILFYRFQFQRKANQWLRRKLPAPERMLQKVDEGRPYPTTDFDRW